jgi:predicted dehydrogenase
MLDMMCHSFEAARFALSKPGQPRDALKVTKIQATTETLKWNRTPFSDALKESMGADYSNSSAPEDFARATVTLLDTTTNQPLIIECTTSWAYNGPGLRLSLEIMGPEYSVDVNTQNTDLKLFFSSNMDSSSVKIGGDEAGKETIEKANATTGLLPTIANEAFTYGYIAENQDMVSSFLKGEMPKETWRDGLEVMKVIMAMYLSADAGRTVSGEELEGDSVRSYVPLCTR